jgi:uncharacterized protein VirK/YbjX
MAIVRSLWKSFLETRRSENLYQAFLRAGAACRILLFPSQMKQLQELGLMKKDHFEVDRFFFLTHKFYLSRKFTLAQRIQCAIDHCAYEKRNHGALYHDLVYRSSGLVLWRAIVDGTRFTLRLSASKRYRYEGVLSARLFVDGTKVCTMSFSYVNTGVFGNGSDIAMFITRHQTERNDALERFRATFKQNSPQYFCLAALSAIAMVNGMPSLFAIKHDAQIHYEDRYANGFKNSYSNFWLQFGAEENDHQSYRLAVPLPLAPLGEVKHRARAVGRRRNWAQVIHATRQAMLELSLVDEIDAHERVARPALSPLSTPSTVV